MEPRSKNSQDLLSLEKPSSLEERLQICNEIAPKGPENIKTSAAQLLSQPSVLDRVKSFLPLMDEANRKLSSAIEDKGAEHYDIETITGGEEASHIQMDLALGVTELYTPEAIAAAERAMNGHVRPQNVGDDSDGSDGSDSEDEDGDEKDEKSEVPFNKHVVVQN